MSGTPTKYRNNPGARLWPRLTPNGECMEWTGTRNERGYGGLRVDGRLVKAHRFAYELTCGPIPDGLDVLHSCDNPPCCNPAHLSVGDAVRNADEMVSRGRHGGGYGKRGDDHHQHILTPEDVQYIRENPECMTVSALARKFNVARATVRAARDRKTWSHL